MTRAERLLVAAVQHQGWLALDEEGLEAAAATGVTMEPVSAPSTPLELTLHAFGRTEVARVETEGTEPDLAALDRHRRSV